MAMMKRSKKWAVAFDTTIPTVVYPMTTVSSPDIELDTNGVLTIKRNWQFDGVTWAPDRKRAMRAALAHDALYDLMRHNLLPLSMQHQADDCFYLTCLEDGVPKWRALLYRKALRMFGNRALEKKQPLHQFINSADG